MGLGWDTNKNLGSEGLSSEVLVVQLGQTSKPVGTLIIPDADVHNQSLPQKKVSYYRLREGGRNGSAAIGS